MREHLFRGKSTGDIGSWITGYYHYDKTTDTHYICQQTSLVRYEVQPGTVGMLLPITDRRGNVLYEGDIMEFYDEIEKCMRKSFFEWQSDQMQFRMPIHTYMNLNFSQIEKIGNIHDNPELLEK